MKNVFAQFPHFKNFVGQVLSKNLKQPTSENSLIVLAESEEAANHIIDSQVGDVLSKMGEQNVIDIHITDQKAYNNYPLWLKATFYIDTSSEEKLKESTRLVKLLFYIVDRTVTLRLSNSNRQKSEKARKTVEKQKMKEKAEENEEATL